MRNRYRLPEFLVTWLSCSVVCASVQPPTFAPLDRLLANTTAFVKENPTNAHGYYTLARIHYFAFANKAPFVAADEENPLPRVIPDWMSFDFAHRLRWQHARDLILKEMKVAAVSAIPVSDLPKFRDAVLRKMQQLSEEGWTHARLEVEDVTDHAVAAMRNFGKAIGLAPGNGLYHLGLACLIEQFLDYAEKLEISQLPDEFRGLSKAGLGDLYYTAYERSIADALKRTERPVLGLRTLVGYEAGKAYLRVAEAEGASREDEEKTKIREVRTNLKTLKNLPITGGITPVVLSLGEHRALSELLRPDLRISFDLDGDGIAERWPWVKPTTGILVWDPDGKGNITSGRQLFGSVTWWLFFEDGYHALDALDDSRDGALTGAELDGICVWFDRDSDGKSGPGEVRPVSACGIASLATKATGHDQGCPMSLNGLTLTDGRTLPTYDWIASPIESALHSQRDRTPPAP